MSLEDRDWYRAEVERRRSASKSRVALKIASTVANVAVGVEHRRSASKSRIALKIASAVAVVAVGLVVLPVAVVSRCDFDSWTSMPEVCWQSSWSALRDRVSGNMAATRGWPVVIVQSKESVAPPPHDLPTVIRPSQH